MSAASRRKRKGKPAAKAPRQDFIVRQVRAATEQAKAPKMLKPYRCASCGHVSDAMREPLLHYVDCRTWRCPNCSLLLDDRHWPGSNARPVEPPAPPPRRGPKRLPWEGADQPDFVDPAIADLMRVEVARKPIRTQHPPRLTDPDRKDRR